VIDGAGLVHGAGAGQGRGGRGPGWRSLRSLEGRGANGGPVHP
jgi:hypothetical protein